jgi:hypothetical protein
MVTGGLQSVVALQPADVPAGSMQSSKSYDTAGIPPPGADHCTCAVETPDPRSNAVTRADAAPTTVGAVRMTSAGDDADVPCEFVAVTRYVHVTAPVHGAPMTGKGVFATSCAGLPSIDAVTVYVRGRPPVTFGMGQRSATVSNDPLGTPLTAAGALGAIHVATGLLGMPKPESFPATIRYQHPFEPGAVFGHTSAGYVVLDASRILAWNETGLDHVVPPSSDRSNPYTRMTDVPLVAGGFHRSRTSP